VHRFARVEWVAWAPIAAVAVVAVAYLLTLRPGQDLTIGDDFAQYILHARNIVEGNPYADTGYLYNPDAAVVGPAAYPPVFPLMLAPLWALFGLNLLPMKVLMVLVFCGALALSTRLMRAALTPLESAAIVLIVGLNPFFWEFKDNVLSDLPFLFFVCLALLVAGGAMERLRTHPDSTPWWLVLGLGLTLYLAYGTRVAGVALVATVVVFELLTWRRVRRPTLLALVVFSLLAGVQEVLIPDVSGYLQQLSFDPREVQSHLSGNIRSLSAGFGSVWSVGSLSPLSLAAAVVGFALIGSGYVVRFRAGPSVLEVFLPVYLAVILAWPRGTELRFLIPVIPFSVYYAWVGLRRVRLPDSLQRGRTLAAIVLVGAVLVFYATRYRTLERGPIASGLAAADTQALLAFVRNDTSTSDVVVFRRPRAMVLFTGRRSGPYAPGPGHEDVSDYLNDVHADLVVSAPQDQRFWTALAAQNPESLTRVFQNPTYSAYRVGPLPLSDTRLDSVTDVQDGD
jgi:4-amino-4-deoxy-L-arabinose transferase-like glycosyltransferase